MLQPINTENFQQMLAQFSTSELEGMIVKFPYFEQAHVLLAKKYQQENSPKFDQQLQLAALYIQDRELLYNLFNDKNVVEPFTGPVTAVDLKEEQKENAVQPPVTQPAIVTEVKEDPEKIVEQNKIYKPVEVTPVSDDDALALALEEIKQSAEAIQQISENVKDVDPVQTIEPIDIDSVIEIGIIETSETEVVAIKEKPEIIIEVEQVETVEVEAIEEENETAEETVAQEESTTESFSRIAPHTFDEWLQAFNNKSVSKAPEKQRAEEVQAPDDELNRLYTANITVDYLHGLVKEETNYAKGLERFIDEQIQKHKHPEIRKRAPENEPDTELITETMAKVYEMQKKYALAIKAYEALALKFPEKSSLFAARINFLKNIL